jgi:hypothetical protein
MPLQADNPPPRGRVTTAGEPSTPTKGSCKSYKDDAYLVWTYHISTLLKLLGMSGYKSFAVWGAGNQGAAIIKAFLKQSNGASVKVLTRPVRPHICRLML